MIIRIGFQITKHQNANKKSVKRIFTGFDEDIIVECVEKYFVVIVQIIELKRFYFLIHL